MLAFATASMSAPPPRVETWNLNQICISVAMDGESLANMYKRGFTKKQINNTIAQRAEAFPEMAFSAPGIKTIIGVLDMIKKEQPEVMQLKGFEESIGFAVFKKCTKSNAKGWVKTIPGKAIIRHTKPKKVEYI